MSKVQFSLFQKSMELLENVRIPVAGTRIYKDECVYTYDTPVSTLRYFS